MNSVSRRKWRLALSALGVALATGLAARVAAAQEMTPTGVYPGLSATGVFGAHGGLTQSLGSAGSEMDTGAGAGFWLQVNALRAPWDEERSFRFTLAGSLGASSAGFEGAIASEGAYGLRWGEAFGEPQRSDISVSSLDDTNENVFKGGGYNALFARIGYAMHLTHNDRVESSLVEVPRLEIGYQLLGGFGLEARAQAGFVITGALSHENAARPLGMGVGWGGRLTAYGRYGSIELGIERINPLDDPLGPVDVADGRICVIASRDRGATFGICTAGRAEQAILRRSDGAMIESTSVYAGLLLGVGVH